MKNKNLIEKLKSYFDKNNQITESKIQIGKTSFSIFYIECLIDRKLFSTAVMQPIEKLISQKNAENIFSMVYDSISVPSKKESDDINQIKDNLFAGQAIIVFENKAICCPLFSAERRSVEEPPNARVIKGPREGFVEELSLNTSLVRKRLKTEKLKIVDVFIGERSKTRISVFYMNDIAKPEVVDEIVSKLKKISIDAVLDSYYIESFLEGEKLKFIRRLGNTEKPDVFCAKILEGRVGILVDGSPIALTAPFILLEDLQSPGDYYSIPSIATFTRLMRFVGLIVSVFAPAIYVALQSYNYRILSVNFLITILSSIEGLSIPPLLEILIVIFLFEIITEASLRMPDPLGIALSIIGALALGNTAVDAGIISPPSIVIVAVSSVALYIIPDQIAETRILRLIVTALGGIVGLYGIFVSIVILSTYLSSIESFGVPYLAPYAPYVKGDLNDALTMKPIDTLKTRPKTLAGKDKIRQGDNKKWRQNNFI